MSTEENKTIIRRLFEEVANGHNLDVLDELVAEDVVNHAAAAEHQRGIEGYRHVMEWGMALSPDARYEILDIIAEGDMVACRVRASGTMQGELFGVPPTGKCFSVEHVHWHRVSRAASRWSAGR